MFRNTSFILFTLLLLILSIQPYHALAHNGARDELGGHFRQSDCMYLLHNPSDIAKTASNLSELISLIKDYNSNSSCNHSLNEENVDLEGYMFATIGTTSSKPVITNQPLHLGKTYEASLEKCIDGDTATFFINGHPYKTRFLYIDTPESTNKQESFGKEASEFTCSSLQKGKITLETDGPALYDKYDRLLAWVFIDGKLHQETITKAGLVKDFYDYGSYKYENELQEAMQVARAASVGMYKVTITENPDKEVIETTSTVKNADSTETQVVVTRNSETVQQTSYSSWLGLVALTSVFLFFMYPRFSRKRGVEPLLAHKLWTKNLWINALLLLPIYTALFFFVLIILVIEVVQYIRLKK